jgi:predicted nuclease of predicted toxin-antitoxin system
LSLSVVLAQNIPPSIAEYLRLKRPTWDIRHVRDIGLSSVSDQAIFEWAQQQAAVVITFDEDFAGTRMYPVGSHAGVIRLRVWPTTVEVTEAALERLLSTTEDAALPGSLIIIDDLRIRIRRAVQHG